MILTWLLAMPVALAEEAHHLRFGLSAGFETVTNDPFVRRLGGRLGVSIAPAPWVEFGTSFTFFPILGGSGADNPSWKPIAKQLFLENSLSPDISLMDWEWQTVARIRAVSYKPGAMTIAFGALAGVAVVHSVEDPVAFQVDVSDPDFQATQRQVHPGPVGGLYCDALGAHLGMRFRVETVSYIETVNSTTLEMKNNILVGAEMLTWF